MNRRQFLTVSGTAAAGLLVSSFVPRAFAGALDLFQTQTAVDMLSEMRAQMGGTPITPTKISEGLTMLAGPGGNVLVLDGPEGKLLVDSFVQPAWPNLQKALEAISDSKIHTLIDTHWHFDHADNNGSIHRLGAAIVAHENTKKRLGESHDLTLGAGTTLHLTPVPVLALPTLTFADTLTVKLNGETLELQHAAPAHTDSDIFVHFTKANVLHMGDTYFTGAYPFFDLGTGGKINGMIAAANRAINMTNATTKIVPGHGAISNKAELTKYRDMLTACRDAVQKLKASGKSLADTQKAKPTDAFDAVWGKGMMGPNDFVALIYNSL